MEIKKSHKQLLQASVFKWDIETFLHALFNSLAVESTGCEEASHGSVPTKNECQGLGGHRNLELTFSLMLIQLTSVFFIHWSYTAKWMARDPVQNRWTY